MKNLKQLQGYRTCISSPKIAVRNATDLGYLDYENRSGILTKILRKEGKEGLNRFSDLSSYYTIVDNPYYLVKREKPTPCKLCSETFTTNRDGSLTRHIRDSHNLTPEEYIHQFPEASEFFPLIFKALEREKFLKEKVENKIQCPLCGEFMKKITRTHIEFKHKMTTEEFKQSTHTYVLSSDTTRKKSQVLYEQRNQTVGSGFNKVSYAEKEVRDFLKSLGGNLDLNRRKYLEGMEVDIYIPELNLGIEYNGLYYHSEEMGRGREYHITKTRLAEEAGIHLIQIFSDEWQFKRKIVESKLRRLMKMGEDKIVFARKCEIREIGRKECSDFLHEYHIQGVCSSSIKLGAFSGEVLVGVATFSKPRLGMGNKKVDTSILELTRFCVKDGIQITGLLPRFLGWIKRNRVDIFSVYSYADRRYTYKNSNVYLKTGFRFIGETAPSYWYTKYSDVRYHRFGFAKYKLKLRGWDIEGRTEQQIMKEKGFNKIWDCGNLKYEYKIK